MEAYWQGWSRRLRHRLRQRPYHVPARLHAAI